MTDLPDEVVAAVRQMPQQDQDDLAQALIQMTQTIRLDDTEPEHRAAMHEGMQQAARGEFATDEEVADELRRFDR